MKKGGAKVKRVELKLKMLWYGYIVSGHSMSNHQIFWQNR